MTDVDELAGLGERLGLALPAELTGWHRDLEAAAEAALAGGHAAMAFYDAEDLDIENSKGSGPVTAADRAAHTAILECLSRRCPVDRILSEEGSHEDTGQPAGRLWVVDPLDGTKEFIARNGEFSVMIGLAIDGAARLGAVYRPDPDLLYLGIADRAAWRIASAATDSVGQPMAIEGPVPDPLRMVRSRSHPDERIQRIEDALGARIIVSGSVGTKCALISEGMADVYVHPVPFLKEWDTCAPEALLRGAGGRVTDCCGDPLSYGKTRPVQPFGIFAARAEIVDTVAPAVLAIGAEMSGQAQV